jgi:hypothetical protein
MGRRAQFMLTDVEYTFLSEEADRTGLSMAELVRRAVDEVYRLHERERVHGVELSVGVWRRPDAAVVGRRPGKRI